MAYNPDEGKESTFNMHQSISRSGDGLSKALEFKIGGARKKRYRYSNGTKTKFRRTKHKTNRNKSNVSKLFRTYKRFKEKCYR